jgi:hypothetical protein
VFYQATVRGLVEKAESDASSYVEIWLEKDALARADNKGPLLFPSK